MAGHSDFVLSVDFSPDGNRIVSGSSDKLVVVWDSWTGTKVSRCFAIAFNAVGAVAVVFLGAGVAANFYRRICAGSRLR